MGRRLGSTDWSGFLGTVTQTGATFVSIVGGFLAARVIQLGSDRSAARAKVAAAQDRCDRLKKSVHDGASRLLLYHTSVILSRILSQLPEKLPTGGIRAQVDDVVELYHRITPSAMAEMSGQSATILNRVTSSIDSAYVQIGEIVSRDPRVVTIPELRAELQALSPLEDKIYVEVFGVLRGYSSILGTGYECIQGHICADLPPEYLVLSPDGYLDVGEKWRADRRELELATKDLDYERDIYSLSVSPAGLREAIQILAFSIASIVVLPLLYMIQAPAIDLRERIYPNLPGISHLNLLVGLLAEAFILFIAYLRLLLRTSESDRSDNHRSLHSSCSGVASTGDDRREVRLPEAAANLPSPFDGQMLNTWVGYLNRKGFEVSLNTGTPSTAELHGFDDAPDFTGESELDALRVAYEYIYSKSKEA